MNKGHESEQLRKYPVGPYKLPDALATRRWGNVLPQD